MTAAELERIAQAAADAEGDRIDLEYPVEPSVVRAVLAAVVPAIVEACAAECDDRDFAAESVRDLAADLLPRDAG